VTLISARGRRQTVILHLFNAAGLAVFPKRRIKQGAVVNSLINVAELCYRPAELSARAPVWPDFGYDVTNPASGLLTCCGMRLASINPHPYGNKRLQSWSKKIIAPGHRELSALESMKSI
jgi:hypothetical protein